MRGVRFGRRQLIGAGYEAAATPAFSFFALFEFDDLAGLQAYLRHAAHVALGQLFWSCCLRTLVFDYELAGPDPFAALKALVERLDGSRRWAQASGFWASWKLEVGS